MSKATPPSRISRVLSASLLALGLAVPLAGGVALAASPHGHGDSSLPGPPGQYAALTDDHLRHLIHGLMAKVDEDQRSRLMEIAVRAKPEFDAFEARARQARAPRRDILLADTIDRQALEQVRVAEMQVADERSRRVDQLLVDVVGVLTPQQRADFQAHLQSASH